MENDPPIGPSESGLPRTAPFVPSSGETRDAGHAALVAAPPIAPDPSDRGGIFGALVKGDADIAGLVAYSIYKQNRLDWHRAFEAAQGRVPDEAELSAYIIGEGTPRRIATYRHLAEATLAGNGPNVDGGSDARGRVATPRLTGAEAKTLTNGLLLTYGLIAILFVVVLWFALHVTH